MFNTDKREWARLHMDTPIRPPNNKLDRDALKPGTAVQHSDGKHFGRVHKNPDAEANPTSTEAIVIGHGWDNSEQEKFVWRGDVRDFRLEWRID